MLRFWYTLEGKARCIEAEFDSKACRIIREQKWEVGEYSGYVEVWQFGKILRRHRW